MNTEFVQKHAVGTRMENEVEMHFDAKSENEAFARIAVAAFVSPLNPTLEEISDIKTAVSEAVTNAIIHGYEAYRSEEKETVGGQDADGVSGFGETDAERKKQQVFLHCRLEGDVLEVEVKDYGCGIENVEQAMEPLFTTKPELDRSGMGFSFMEAFMDDLQVESFVGQGTVVHMKKKLGISSWIGQEE